MYFFSECKNENMYIICQIVGSQLAASRVPSRDAVFSTDFKILHLESVISHHMSVNRTEHSRSVMWSACC